MSEEDYLVLIVDADCQDLEYEVFIDQLRKNHIYIPVVIIADHGRANKSGMIPFQDEIHFFSKPVILDSLMTYLRRRAMIFDLGIRFFPALPNLTSWEYEMEYRTDEINPTQVSNFLAKMLFLAGYCEEGAMTKIEIAIHEAIVNAVDHGNLALDSSLKPKTLDDEDGYYKIRCDRLESREYGSRIIGVLLRARGTQCEITISDEGKGFDHQRVMESLRGEWDPSKLLKAHGRGLVLIMYSVDDVTFNDSGNSITLKIVAPQEMTPA
jgi:anti-sigma regulatory factor (Ser/Thr protein kinase)